MYLNVFIEFLSRTKSTFDSDGLGFIEKVIKKVLIDFSLTNFKSKIQGRFKVPRLPDSHLKSLLETHFCCLLISEQRTSQATNEM